MHSFRSILSDMGLAVALTAAATPAAAATIVEPSRATALGRSSVYAQQYSVVSWTQADAWSNVAISASLVSSVQGIAGQAYLMTQVGSGTTLAHQLAVADFTFAWVPDYSTLSYVDLFAGLSLGAGSYYIVFASADMSARAGIGVGTGFATGPGVVVAPVEFSEHQIPPDYAPAADFGSSGGVNAFFRVTGDQVMAIPLPSTAWLAGIGLLLWAQLRRPKWGDQL